jgi:hypothetical protein
MRAGRLSYSTGAAGKRRIDVAELGRVFEIKEGRHRYSSNGALSGNGAAAPKSTDTHSAESDAVRTVREECERTVARQDEVIRDLRARLDASEAERRRLSERLTGLLTHRQAGSVPAVAPKLTAILTGPRVPWWRGWLR